MPKNLDNAALSQLAQKRLETLYETDAQILKARPDAVVRQQIAQCKTTVETIAALCEAYATRPALGQRDVIEGAPEAPLMEQKAPIFQTITYGELWQRVQSLASGWQAQKEPLVRPGDLVGIIGFPSIDYVVADFACLYLNAAANPLATDLPQADLKQIVNEAAFVGIVSSWKSLDKVVAALPDCPTVKSITVIDLPENIDPEPKLREIEADFASKGRSLKISPIWQLEAKGEHEMIPYVLPQGPKALRMLCYTSGSTGSPKGAIFSEELMHQYWTITIASGIEPDVEETPQICVGFSPLNHIMGRFGLIRTLSSGGCLYFTYGSDMSTLFEDMRLVRPTRVDLVPRVAELIFQHFQTEVIRRRHTHRDQKALQDEVMAEMHQGFLGDRLLSASIGSAPSSPEIRRFIMDCFEIPLFESYGLTEAGPVMIDGKILPHFVPQYKLLEVPELGYHLSDKPYPRGTLHIRSKRAVPGYYKNENATKDLYDDEGFLRTGDIFEERRPGELVYIDREKNVLKLSQGEFVTVWRLETLFEQSSHYLKQVYLYGNSSRSYLLGVIVPDTQSIADYFANLHKIPTENDVHHLVRREIVRIAKESGLRAYEVPRNFILEDEPFSIENGLLTSIKKNARQNLKRKYSERLEALYLELERKQLEELAKLAETGGEASASQLVSKALEATLGISSQDLLMTQRFGELGGDSLGAVTFSATLEQLCGVSIAASFVLSPATTLAEIIQKVDEQLTEGGADESEVRFETIHGQDATTIRAEDLRIDKFLRDGEIEAAKQLMTPNLTAAPKTFLLTGATGWLGRFLCMELLEHASRHHSKIYVIVRAASDEKAAMRLNSVFLTDPLLKDRFDQLAARHLVVFAGDLEKFRFGMTPERYQELASKVDAIIHSAALVNHVYTYQQLFQPNVMGSVEVMRLALQERLKAISYVSTVGVLGGAAHTGLIKEDEDVRRMAPVWTIEPEAYAQGYAISKWAGEVLLRDLRDQIEIPINVFRPDLIMPHRKYRGQINAPDLLTRFLASIIYTGIAPQTFYTQPQGSEKPHYDGLPGDFIAAAMVGMALKPLEKLATYNVSNPYIDDGISLDTIVDWVISAGYPINEVKDYNLWFQEFKQRLASLNDEEKAHSSLLLLHMWEHPSAVRALVRPDTERFVAKVQSLRQTIPHLTESFIHKYLADMQELGIIEAPLPRESKKQPSAYESRVHPQDQI